MCRIEPVAKKFLDRLLSYLLPRIFAAEVYIYVISMTYNQEYILRSVSHLRDRKSVAVYHLLSFFSQYQY